MTTIEKRVGNLTMSGLILINHEYSDQGITVNWIAPFDLLNDQCLDLSYLLVEGQLVLSAPLLQQRVNRRKE